MRVLYNEIVDRGKSEAPLGRDALRSVLWRIMSVIGHTDGFKLQPQTPFLRSFADHGEPRCSTGQPSFPIVAELARKVAEHMAVIVAELEPTAIADFIGSVSVAIVPRLLQTQASTDWTTEKTHIDDYCALK